MNMQNTDYDGKQNTMTILLPALNFYLCNYITKLLIWQEFFAGSVATGMMFAGVSRKRTTLHASRGTNSVRFLLQTVEQIVSDYDIPAHVFCKVVAGLYHAFNFLLALR
jgi:hypothetical protein